MHKKTHLIIIYTLFTTLGFGQNLYLQLKSSDSSKLKPKLLPFPNTKTLKEHLENTVNSLQLSGYLNTETTSLLKTNDSTYTTTITPNNQISKISLYYNSLFSQEELRSLLSKNTNISKQLYTINTSELEDHLQNLSNHLSNRGETFNQIQLSNITLKKDSAYASLQINKNKKTHIKNIIIKGYQKFPRKLLKHYSNLKTQQALQPKALEKKSALLNNLRYISEIKKPEILFTKDSATIYLYLKKRPANSFNGFLGFSSNPESQKIEFNGNINLDLINNLNTGEELNLIYHTTENQQKTLNIKAHIPFILNSPVSLEGNFHLFKKDSSFTNSSQNISLQYQLHPNIKIGGGYQHTESNTLSNNTNELDFTKNEYLINFNHSKFSQNPIFPTKTQTSIAFGFGNRKTSSTTSQQSITVSSHYNLKLNNRNSIHLKNQSYFLFSEEILENELQFIGGINSIRGFQESSIPSNQHYLFLTEYRYSLSNNIIIHSVLDYGITKNNTTQSSNSLLGFGIGFGIKSKTNLLRLIYANNKTNNLPISFSSAKVHLSLTTQF